VVAEDGGLGDRRGRGASETLISARTTRANSTPTCGRVRRRLPSPSATWTVRLMVARPVIGAIATFVLADGILAPTRGLLASPRSITSVA
jgi:hypothetical protein